jgi:hypothetical protein
VGPARFLLISGKPAATFLSLLPCREPAAMVSFQVIRNEFCDEPSPSTQRCRMICHSLWSTWQQAKGATWQHQQAKISPSRLTASFRVRDPISARSGRAFEYHSRRGSSSPLFVKKNLLFNQRDTCKDAGWDAVLFSVGEHPIFPKAHYFHMAFGPCILLRLVSSLLMRHVALKRQLQYARTRGWVNSRNR